MPNQATSARGAPPYPVLFVEPVGERGGAEISLLHLLAGLDRQLFSPLAACLEPGPLVGEFQALEVPVYVFPKHRFSHLWVSARVVKELCRIVRQHGVRLIYSNLGKGHLYGGAAARLTARPCVLRLCDMVSRRPIDRAAVAVPAHCTVVDSHAVREHFTRLYPSQSRRRFETVYLCVDPSLLQYPSLQRREARGQWGVPPEAPLVGCMSRLQPWKGQEVLLEAAAQVQPHHPAARFLIGGGALFGRDLDYPERLRRRAAELGLQERVIFTGHLANPYPVMAALDILALPSVSPEPFGTVTAEAMALGIPVVASRAGGIPEVVVDGETGVLVAPGEPEALAAALLRLLGDPALSRQMGRQGRARAERMFTREIMVRKTTDVFLRLLSENGL